MYAIHSSGQIPPGEVNNELHRQQPKSSTLSKPHPCDRCSKSFSSVHQLSQHTRVRRRFILLFKSSESPTICYRFIPVKSPTNVIIANVDSSSKVTSNSTVVCTRGKDLTSVQNVEEPLFKYFLNA